MTKKTVPALGDIGQTAQANVQAAGAAMTDMWKTMSGLSLPMDAMSKLQAEYLAQATAMWNNALTAAPAAGKPAPVADKRFSAQAWGQNPASALTAQSYLLNARTLMQMADSVQGDAKTKAKIRFAVQQWVDAASPANFLATNPEALAKAVETRGGSISQGMQMLWKDIEQGHMSQTDESVFEVGRNVATSEGAVVFENELFQLIEYKPLTAKVGERPMLFVPPCINKYYILDLQPENSVIRYTVEQGHRVFVVSWRNPDDSMAATTWDDYIEKGPIKAIAVVQAITGAATINTLGFCVGGTILSTALAVLAARGEQPAESMTLLTTLLDFSDTGILDVVISRSLTAASSMNTSRTPVSLKSSSVVSRVIDSAGCSPRAASTASAVDKIVPPTQKPRVLIVAAPVMPCTTSIALIGPFSM